MSQPSITATSRRPAVILWWLLAVLLLAEFVYFDRETSRHYAWVYPRWNDQIQYLGEVYHGYDLAQTDGLASGLSGAATKPSAQGMLTAVVTVGVLHFAGASRSAALSVNILAWLALQAAVFAFVLWRYRSAVLAWISVGLLLLWQTPLSAGPGSAWDFRLDFICACLFGLTLVAAMMTGRFNRVGWSLVFGLMVGLTLLERFLTGTYFVLMYVGFGAWLALTPDRWRRLGNLGLSALVAAIVAAPFFWINRRTVWEYYFLGHFSGPERAIRESHLGIGGSLAWTFSELFHSHLNSWFVITALVVSAILVVARLASRAKHRPGLASDVFVPAALFFFAPALILSLHDEKSFVVLSALVPPLLVMVIAGWDCFGIADGSLPSKWPLRLAAVVVLGAGIAHFVVLQAKPYYDDGFATDARALNRFADQIATISDQAKLANPTIAVDQVTDSMDAQVLRVICYERHHTWHSFLMTLPTGIMAEKPAVLMDRISHSDFVILHADASDGMYPFDHEMTQMLPQTTAWCDRHLQVASRFSLFGRSWTLYVRPEVVIQAGRSGIKATP